MHKWLIIFDNGAEKIVEGEDLYELHAQLDSDEIRAIVRLDIELTERTDISK